MIGFALNIYQVVVRFYAPASGGGSSPPPDYVPTYFILGF